MPVVVGPGAGRSGPLPPWRDNAAGPVSRSETWRAVWESWDLIAILAAKDLTVRYKQAVLGAVWVLVQPVVTVVVFTFVFDRLARVGSQGVPYPLFALVGMVVWTYFAVATVRSSEALVANPELVTKVSLPRICPPLASLLPPLVDLAVSLLLVAVAMVAYGVGPGWRVLAVPAWIALLVLTAFGVGIWLTGLNVRYRDVAQAVPPVIQVWLFASPVAYPADALSGWKQVVYGLNPMSGVISLARWSLLGTPWPGWPLAVSALTSLLVASTGLARFRRSERDFADVI